MKVGIVSGDAGAAALGFASTHAVCPRPFVAQGGETALHGGGGDETGHSRHGNGGQRSDPWRRPHRGDRSPTGPGAGAAALGRARAERRETEGATMSLGLFGMGMASRQAADGVAPPACRSTGVAGSGRDREGRRAAKAGIVGAGTEGGAAARGFVRAEAVGRRPAGADGGGGAAGSGGTAPRGGGGDETRGRRSGDGGRRCGRWLRPQGGGRPPGLPGRTAVGGRQVRAGRRRTERGGGDETRVRGIVGAGTGGGGGGRWLRPRGRWSAAGLPVRTGVMGR